MGRSWGLPPQAETQPSSVSLLVRKKEPVLEAAAPPAVRAQGHRDSVREARGLQGCAAEQGVHGEGTSVRAAGHWAGWGGDISAHACKEKQW